MTVVAVSAAVAWGISLIHPVLRVYLLYAALAPRCLADEARKSHPHLDVTVHVDEGDPAAVITEVAASARLAVVGTHGRTGLARFLLGSVSTQVLEHLTTVTAAVR